MSTTAHQDKSTGLAEFFAVRSDKLKELRAVIQHFKNLNIDLAGAVQFRLVVDTNVILGDILWLVAERRNLTAKTDLMEGMEAQTIDVYAPPALFVEVEEKIPLIAADKNLDVTLMYAEWAIYKTKLKRAEPDADKVRVLKNGVDPDDADFIALAQTIAAAGVVSKDKHIAMMGGDSISVEFITHLRNYSRDTAIELNIKVNGVLFAVVGIVAIRALFAGFSALIDGINKAPDWVKLVLLVGGMFVALHPGARASVISFLKSAFTVIGEGSSMVIEHIADAAVLADKHKDKAQVHLQKAMKELEKGNLAEITRQVQPMRIKAKQADVAAKPRKNISSKLTDAPD